MHVCVHMTSRQNTRTLEDVTVVDVGVASSSIEERCGSTCNDDRFIFKKDQKIKMLEIKAGCLCWDRSSHVNSRLTERSSVRSLSLQHGWDVSVERLLKREGQP